MHPTGKAVRNVHLSERVSTSVPTTACAAGCEEQHAPKAVCRQAGRHVHDMGAPHIERAQGRDERVVDDVRARDAL